jgi:hypothetical protein
MLRRFLPILIAGPTLAQQAAAPMKVGDLTVQGNFRSRLEAWDWFDASSSGLYQFSGNVLRVSIGQQLERIDWQIELAAPFLLGLPDDAVAPGAQGQLGLGANYFLANNRSSNAGMIFPKQAFVRVKRLFGDPAQSLRIGRFEFSDGAEVTPASPVLAAVKRDRIAQRLIGPFGWTHVGRSFDGGHYVWNRGRRNVTLVAGLPTRGVFQVDGWGNLKSSIVYAAATGQIIGKKNSGEWRVLGSYYNDWRRIAKTDNRPAAVRSADLANLHIATFGGHYIHAISTGSGTVDLLAWGVGQTGQWGALDHHAASLAIEGGYQPAVLPRLKPWIRAGMSYGSGDDDPSDEKHGSFFQILPTPRPFARFPFFNMMNNLDAFASLILRPHQSLTVRSDVRTLRLASRNDLWYAGGGAFQPWTFGYLGRATGGSRSLANLYDVSADYAANARLTISAYYGFAAGRAVIRSIYPNGKNAGFGYVELLYRF